MKVKELKEFLNDLDDDADVLFSIDDGCCNEYIELELAFADAYSRSLGAIRFKALPGYKSCIQAGQTKEADKKYWAFVNKKEQP